jgi:glycerol-1-phosphate dehydrogenase [NAD(P)+]
VKSPPIEVAIGADALERLVAYVDRPALVVMDPNTEVAAGSRVLADLRAAGVDAEPLVFEQCSGLIASPAAVARVVGRLRGEVLAVAVGSGVITDIVRYAAHQSDHDFVSVPTAASMDGYASTVAALQLDGVKVTFPARAPLAIFADPRIAAAAPAELTRSGVGDLLGKATARVDWLASHLLYGEPYRQDVTDRVLEALSFAAGNVEPILSGEPEAARGLLVGLVQSGIAMALAGSSRPASGCEHHASHFWDLLAARGLRPHHAHGLQVGYATHFVMRLQRFAFGDGVSTLRRPVAPVDPLGPAAREWLGEPTVEIVAAVDEKQRFASSLQSWPQTAGEWEQVRARLAPALELFDAVERALAAAGIPTSPGYLDVDETMLRATFRYATRLRARYTTLDFLEGQRILEQVIDWMLGSGCERRASRSR